MKYTRKAHTANNILQTPLSIASTTLVKPKLVDKILFASRAAVLDVVDKIFFASRAAVLDVVDGTSGAVSAQTSNQ
jgi:hypothetical protein